MFIRIAAVAASIFTASSTWAATIAPTDLDTIGLGAFVVGPVGVTVDSSFVSPDGSDLGDFSGGAACPDGFVTCVPPEVAAGTVFTFVQTIVPGAEVVANDPPFALGAPLASPGVVSSYGFTMPIPGFTGVAGYSFSEAAAAGIGFEIDGGVGGLSFASVGGEWTDGESVSFFFQTTQPPLGPGPAYALTGSDASGVAIGPVPAPIPVPAGLPLLLAGLGALAFLRRR